MENQFGDVKKEETSTNFRICSLTLMLEECLKLYTDDLIFDIFLYLIYFYPFYLHFLLFNN
jgi:hypothetical protein